MSKFIVNRPVKLGATRYPKSPRIVEIPDADLKGWFAEAMLKEGALSPVVEPKVEAPKVDVEGDAKPAPKPAPQPQKK